ncbi:MAG: hypothetical protein ACK58T_32895, partial [Phycisphaerae bacterium]
MKRLMLMVLTMGVFAAGDVRDAEASHRHYGGGRSGVSISFGYNSGGYRGGYGHGYGGGYGGYGGHYRGGYGGHGGYGPSFGYAPV